MGLRVANSFNAPGRALPEEGSCRAVTAHAGGTGHGVFGMGTGRVGGGDVVAACRIWAKLCPGRSGNCLVDWVIGKEQGHYSMLWPWPAPAPAMILGFSFGKLTWFMGDPRPTMRGSPLPHRFTTSLEARRAQGTPGDRDLLVAGRVSKGGGTGGRRSVHSVARRGVERVVGRRAGGPGELPLRAASPRGWPRRPHKRGAWLGTLLISAFLEALDVDGRPPEQVVAGACEGPTPPAPGCFDIFRRLPWGSGSVGALREK